MIIDGKYINEGDIYSSENKFMKKHNNIYISDEQVNILRNYDINIEKYNNISDLIFDIEEYLNISNSDLDDLEWVSQTLSEYNYYNNTNK